LREDARGRVKEFADGPVATSHATTDPAADARLIAMPRCAPFGPEDLEERNTTFNATV